MNCISYWLRFSTGYNLQDNCPEILHFQKFYKLAYSFVLQISMNAKKIQDPFSENGH